MQDGNIFSKCVGGARWRIMVDQWSNLQRFSGFTRVDQIREPFWVNGWMVLIFITVIYFVKHLKSFELQQFGNLK
jgi:hypothetical protein